MPTPTRVKSDVRATLNVALALAALWSASITSVAFAQAFRASYPLDGPSILTDVVPDVNTSPIHVWFYAGKGGQVNAIRVLGHADEATCIRASRLLFDYQRDLALSNQDPGHLSYGIADLPPSSDPSRVKELRTALDTLAADEPDMVHIHDVSGMPLDADAPPAINELAVFNQRASLGPLFVPLRRVDAVLGGQATNRQLWPAEAVAFTLRLADLKLTQKQFQKLVGLSSSAALIDIRRDLARQLDGLDEFEDLRRGKLDRYLDVESISLKSRNSALATLADVDETIRTLEDLRPFVRFVATYTRIDPSVGTVRERLYQRGLEAAYACKKALASRGWCMKFEQVEIVRGDGRAGLAKLAQSANAMSREDLEAYRSKLRDSVASLDRSIAASRREVIDALRPSAEERLLDALLRGWPPSATRAEDQRMIASVLKQVPNAWKRMFHAYVRTRGVQLGGEGLPIGVLHEPNVVFRVRRLAATEFEVVPHYVAIGPFSTTRDASGLVFVQTPDTYIGEN